MNLDEIRSARRDMEKAITDATVAATNTFRSKTGLSPDMIDINMVDVTSISDHEKRFVVGEVRASVSLLSAFEYCGTVYARWTPDDRLDLSKG